ncbi:hypothetical protein LCGC14_2979150, partial [marine sediment metagenome]
LEGCWIEGVTPDMRVKYGKRVFYFDSVINVKELMDWTASRARARARAVSMTLRGFVFLYFSSFHC